MPFCPKCFTEYNEGVEQCADCNSPLVPVIPDIEVELPPEYKDWIHLARLTSSEYAEMVLEILQKKEIPSVILSGAGHFGLTGQMGMSSFRRVGGGYSLMVPREFVKDADHEAALIVGDEWEKARLIDIEQDE